MRDFSLDLREIVVQYPARLMRIAFCIEYPIGQGGGTEVLVSELIKGFSKDHEIVLASNDDATSLAQSPVASMVRQHIFVKAGRKSRSEARDLAKAIANAKPDLAHFHFGENFAWSNRLPYHCPIYYLDRMNVPCVSTVHLVVSIFSGYCGPQKPAWFKLLLLPLAWSGKMQQLRHTRREVAVSQMGLRNLRRWYWPLRNRFTQFYHSRLAELPAPPAENRASIILNVGHIAWRKGQVVLAEAFARIAPRHPEWILQLAGPFREDDAVPIRRVIQQYGLANRIYLLGQRSDASALMQRAAIYVQPSFWEGLPLGLQEAMFSGCACIGSRINGVTELIESQQTGLLFEAGNVDQLIEALERLITQPSHREQLGKAAAASVRERGMTTQRMVRGYLELYEAVCRG